MAACEGPQFGGDTTLSCCKTSNRGSDRETVSPRTAQLYDRTGDSLDEVERIAI